MTDSTRLNPAKYNQATSDEGQVINENLGNSNHATQIDHDFQIPITNIDDFLLGGSLCSDKDTSTKSPDKTSSNELVSCCSSQHTINLSEKASLQVPVKSSLLDFSILDAGNEKGLILPVETSHANQQKEVFSGSKTESSDTGYKSMYPLGDDSDSNSDSTTDSSVMVNKTAGTGSLHELFSDEEEVDFCAFDSQQPDGGGHAHLSQTPHFQHASIENTNLDKTFSDVSLTKKENSVITTHCSQHSQLLGVFSTDKTSQSSNGTKPVSCTECHINSAIATCGEVKACVTFSPGSLKIYSNPSPPDTHSVTQGSTANLHADASLTSDSLKHLNTNTPHSPSMELKTSGSNIGRSDTRVSTSMITKEKVLECRTYLSPHASFLLMKTLGLNNSDCPVWSNNFKLQAETQSRPNTSAPKLKGLSIKSKNKPQNEILQSSTKSESLVSSNANASLNQSTKLPPTANSFLKTSTQSDTNRCLALPKVSDQRQATAEHGPSGGTLQTAQLAKEKDTPLRSKATAKSLDRLHPSATQRTFIEVQLSCLSGSSSPLMEHNEPVNSKDYKPTQRGTDAELEPTIYLSTVEKSNVMVSNPLFSSLCSIKETHSATSGHNGLKPSTTVETSETLKSSISRLYIKTMEKRSFSTDTALSANYNHFSVRHKIKSFENLANFDKPVIKNSDIQSYPMAHRTSLNQRITGYMGLVNTDCEARQRNLSSYVKNRIPTTPCSPLLGKSQSSIALINLEHPHSSCNTASLTEDNTESDIQKVPDGITPETSQVLSKKHRKFPFNKLRQLRALSMPELEKICKEDYVRGQGAVVDKTEPGIHPTILKKATDTESFPPSATVTNVNRASQGYPESTEVTPQATAETHGHQPGWSIRLEVQLKSAHFNNLY